MPIVLPRAFTKAVYVKSSNERGLPRAHMSNIRDRATIDPAPTITIHVSSPNGFADIEILPDSGADISAAGNEVLRYLGEHLSNLLPSKIDPRAVNGSKMLSIGKIPVTFQLGNNTYNDDLHIYPEITRALLSWRAARGLSILPECDPHPIRTTTSATDECNQGQCSGGTCTCPHEPNAHAWRYDEGVPHSL